jgi:hypothetical protein
MLGWQCVGSVGQADCDHRSGVTGLTLTGTSAADNFVLNNEAGAIKVNAFSAAGGERLVLPHDYNGLSLGSAAGVLAPATWKGKAW